MKRPAFVLAQAQRETPPTAVGGGGEDEDVWGAPAVYNYKDDEDRAPTAGAVGGLSFLNSE